MAKINISLNGTEYSIDESVLAPTKNNLKTHLSTVINGSGSVLEPITYDGVVKNHVYATSGGGEDLFVKVGESALSADDLLGATFTMNDGTTIVVTENNMTSTDYGVIIPGAAISVTDVTEMSYVFDATFTETGLYFIDHYPIYPVSLTFPGALIITLDGVDYSVDAAKVADAVSALEMAFDALANGGEEILEGTGSEYYTFAPTALTFRSTEPLDEFLELKINGETIDPSNYTLEEGSTIVTLPIDYLKTLDVGNYEVDIVSESKSVKGGFTVAAPELNEYGFYYNQPYTAIVDYFGGTSVFFFRENGTMDFILVENSYTEVCSYTIENGILTVNSASGTFTGSATADGIYCNELATTFVLGGTSIAADEDYIYIYKEDLGGYEVTAIDKTKTEYGAIKTGINGIDTVKLADEMFYRLDGVASALTNIVIPDSVVIVGDRTFKNCENLENVAIPNSVTSIEEDAFSGCTSLTSVTIPDSVTSIGNLAFSDCTSLTSVVISDNVTSIGVHAFSGCTSLTSVMIPDSVTSIGSSAFSNCTGLAGVTIPDSVTSIGADAFYKCTSLTSVTIGDSVTYIRAAAFDSCDSLTSITIPDSVTYIGDEAFAYCRSLTSIIFEGTMARWDAVTKGILWNLNVPATHVHCLDGDVAL